jgi:hypothetical protein
MASIHREITIGARPEHVWAAIRVATWANGLVVRELIVDIDGETRRFAYAAVGGRTTHHNSSMQVFADGEGSRLVWITKLLPIELAEFVAGLVDQGAALIKRTPGAVSAPSV